MACAQTEIRNIASYLGVECGAFTACSNEEKLLMTVDKGSQLKGFVSIAKYLARRANKPGILGNSSNEEAVINQWLEYRICYIDRCSDVKELEKTCKEINQYLADKVYFTGSSMTLADVVLFTGFSNIFTRFSFLEKQNYMHLSRWYNQMQNIKGLRQDMAKVFFQKNLIYQGSAH